MKIKQIEIYHIDMPLKEPFIIAYTSFETMPAIVVKVITDTGVVGYGESVPDEHVTGESVYTVFTALRHHIIPSILYRDPRNKQLIQNKMKKTIVQKGAAKEALDIAYYDILGIVSNLPIASL